MTRFPTAGHLCFVGRSSARGEGVRGKKKGRGSTGKGNRYLARVLGEAAAEQPDRHLPR